MCERQLHIRQHTATHFFNEPSGHRNSSDSRWTWPAVLCTYGRLEKGYLHITSQLLMLRYVILARNICTPMLIRANKHQPTQTRAKPGAKFKESLFQNRFQKPATIKLGNSNYNQLQSVTIIESVDSICRDTTDTQYQLIHSRLISFHNHIQFIFECFHDQTDSSR